MISGVVILKHVHKFLDISPIKGGVSALSLIWTSLSDSHFLIKGRWLRLKALEAGS